MPALCSPPHLIVASGAEIRRNGSFDGPSIILSVCQGACSYHYTWPRETSRHVAAAHPSNYRTWKHSSETSAPDELPRRRPLRRIILSQSFRGRGAVRGFRSPSSKEPIFGPSYTFVAGPKVSTAGKYYMPGYDVIMIWVYITIPYTLLYLHDHTVSKLLPTTPNHICNYNINIQVGLGQRFIQQRWSGNPKLARTIPFI